MGKTLLDVQIYGSVCIERMSIQISCLQNCGGEMKIPLSLENPIPQVPLMCIKCGTSYMVIDKFELYGDWKPSSGKVSENFNVPLSNTVEPKSLIRQQMTTLDVSPTENQPWQDQSKGGPDILPSFINRWGTVFVMIE